MEKLKSTLEKHEYWKPYSEYIGRIEGFAETDFSLCIENAKALLEGISREICEKKGIVLGSNPNMNTLLKNTFRSLGYPSTSAVLQIGTSITNIGQQIGVFRNDVGTTAHGKTIDELKRRNDLIKDLTADFLIQSTTIVCCFLIEAFESGQSLKLIEEEIDYDANSDFNEYLDDQYEEFEMGDYSFLASEVLFNSEPNAYKTELNIFRLTSNDETDH